MNFASKKLGILSAGMLAGMWLGLAAGCSTPSSSQKVYDRYAELVASRNQPAKSAPSAAPAQVAAPRPVSKPAEPKNQTPAKATPPAVPAPAKTPAPVPAPARVAEPPPAKVAPPAPAAAPSAPVAAPVQVMAPPSAERNRPVSAPAPVQPTAPIPPTPSVAVSEPAAPAAQTAFAAQTIPLPENASSTESGYMLKVGDGVQVFLRGIPTPDLIEDIIDEEGKISLPFINEVQAAGLAASELERNIRQIYLDQDIYRNITVNVVVPTRSYFILGEVRAAGRFQIMSATRVSQAIAAAGGYTEYASGKVQVKRRGAIVKVIKDARRLERAPEDDILLEPDDVVEVLRSWF